MVKVCAAGRAFRALVGREARARKWAAKAVKAANAMEKAAKTARGHADYLVRRWEKEAVARARAGKTYCQLIKE
jgi:hypothetical protein